MNTTKPGVSSEFQLGFASLVTQGGALFLSCDAKCGIDIEALPARAKNNHLSAREMVGLNYLPACISRGVVAH